MDLTIWSWVFLAAYILMMVGFGVMGQRKVANADDFATARAAYGPLFLAFAFAATTAIIAAKSPTLNSMTTGIR